MRTTLILPDPIFKRAKAAARMLNKTLSELTAEALEQHLLAHSTAGGSARRRTALRTYAMGKERVDLADRDALYHVMEQGG
jgi:hypothetical protein